MKTFTLERTQLINAPIDIVWQFFSDPRNLREITPTYMNFRVTSGPLPPEIFKGQLISYKVSPLFSIPLTWVTEIMDVVPETMFIDEQRKGPYKLWHHEHYFETYQDGVMMTDKVAYALPLGILGKWANTLFVIKQLDTIFEYRKQIVDKQFNHSTV